MGGGFGALFPVYQVTKVTDIGNMLFWQVTTAHPTTTPYQHTLSTHDLINICPTKVTDIANMLFWQVTTNDVCYFGCAPPQHVTLSTHPITTPYSHALSTHYPLIHDPINPLPYHRLPHQAVFSTLLLMFSVVWVPYYPPAHSGLDAAYQVQ